MALAASAPTLSQALWPSTAGPAGRTLRTVMLITLGVLALFVSAKIKIFIEPVPVTMQVFVVLALGLAYGARMGLATVLSYLAVGLAGQPVFTGTPEKGLGMAYMMGPTGGYLIGFALAAFAVGLMAERGWDRKFVLAAVAMVIGVALIHIPGALWLAYGSPFTAPGASPFGGIGMETVVALTKTFLPIDLMKAGLAVLLFPAIRSLLR